MDVSRRQFAMGTIVAASAAALKPTIALAKPVAAVTRDKYWYINPELREFVRSVEPLIATLPKLTIANLPILRKGVFPPAPPLENVPWSKRTIPVKAGHPDVTIYIINAAAGTKRGGILHTHGGGYVSGNVEGDIAYLQDIAQKIDCCIVSVDYRLAPETTYKGSIEDNYAGLKWLHDNADQLGVDTARIAVMGESAGGGHAALLAITARDRGEVPVIFQCLTYPMLDDRTGTSRAVPDPIGVFGWKAEDNYLGWRSFLGMKPGGSNVPKAAVPARQTNLKGLPEAWIGVGSIDLFVSEDMDYARRLIEAGVPVETIVTPGAFHGFDRFTGDNSLARTFNASRLEALRKVLKG